MSQEDVYKILKELGGKATSKQISELARKKFPDQTLYQYVGNRLQKLRTKKVIRYHEGLWEIIEDYA